MTYYFQVVEYGWPEPCVQFWFVEKEFYEEFHAADDAELTNVLNLPSGFDEVSEATFEFDGDKEEGRRLLLAAGYIEKEMFEK